MNGTIFNQKDENKMRIGLVSHVRNDKCQNSKVHFSVILKISLQKCSLGVLFMTFSME